MNTAALAVIFREIGWTSVREAEYPKYVRDARHNLETVKDGSPGASGPGGVLDVARRIVAAADLPDGQLPAGTSSAPAPAASDQAERIRALKIDVDAVKLAAERQGLDPVAALAAAIKDRERDLRTELYVGPAGSGR